MKVPLTEITDAIQMQVALTGMAEFKGWIISNKGWKPDGFFEEHNSLVWSAIKDIPLIKKNRQ